MIKNPTRSDFFMVMVNISLLYVGLLAIDWREKPDPAGTEVTRRLTGRPRKAKSCTEINSGVTSAIHTSSYIPVVHL
ncbi:hypothetical protein [Priestia megaterium]|uniref:hypothetical protein n=1 Tax=Priestia megaterium TaxID=1404 RepID=UPI0013E2924C|nr:hypothetical protein [Priestia megaterium]MED3865933.1 hypothetical protein [Priestia megaterium]MED4100892.1 hypothetical protein [Priestia megaterium]MED4147097.1 hypothetical protein [Priestia megaterium]MED4165356.1 hypothetical protein [Priestia megaterium]MED4198498.1 hypothetical protein [Priestia megaterium]